MVLVSGIGFSNSNALEFSPALTNRVVRASVPVKTPTVLPLALEAKTLEKGMTVLMLQKQV